MASLKRRGDRGHFFSFLFYYFLPSSGLGIHHAFLFMIVFIPSSNCPLWCAPILNVEWLGNEREKIRTQLMSSSPSIKRDHAWILWTQMPSAVSFEANRRDDRIAHTRDFVKDGNEGTNGMRHVWKLTREFQDAHG